MEIEFNEYNNGDEDGGDDEGEQPGVDEEDKEESEIGDEVVDVEEFFEVLGFFVVIQIGHIKRVSILHKYQRQINEKRTDN